MNTKYAIIILTAVILGGGALFYSQSHNENLGASKKVVIPPYELTIDEPGEKPERIREQLELITAGGLYPDRKINIVITERTSKKSRDALAGYNVTLVKEVPTLSKEEEDNILDNRLKK